MLDVKSPRENVQAKVEDDGDKYFGTVMKPAEEKEDYRGVLAFYRVRTDMRSITVSSN